MTVKELIEALLKLDPHIKVKIYDLESDDDEEVTGFDADEFEVILQTDT